MTTDNIGAYNAFLKRLGNCKMCHVVAYRDGKIPGIAADDLMQEDLNLPVFANEHKLLVKDQFKYLTYKNNIHHWTTFYCWEVVIPLICRELGIELKKSDFYRVNFIWNDCDFSYHEHKAQMSYTVNDVTTASIKRCQTSLRGMNDCPNPMLSLFHSLFILAHRSGYILNETCENNVKLAVNTDSMSIPVIPVLASLVKEVLVVDNRTGMSNLKDEIMRFAPTHYLSLFTEENFIVNKKHIMNIM